MQQEEWITIFIHGSLGLRPNFAISTLIKLLQDDISNSTYKKTVEIIRDDPVFFHNQPMQARGLHPIQEQQEWGAWLCTQLFDEIHKKNFHEKNRYYTFGWSGLISPTARYDASQEFYAQLKQELERLALENMHPKIRLLCYSHGGNTALYLAHLRNTLFNNDTFIIDELILLGTPIQRETDYLICHPMFKKIYNFFSRNDRVQRMDCFSFKRFFSQRKFNSCSRYTIPEHIKQIEIQCWVPPRYTKKQQRRLVDRSPGHSELWFFGWPEHENSSYRKHFPLYPVPVVCYLPVLIHTINNHAKELSDIIIEMCPHNGTLFIRPRYSFNKKKIPFLKKEHIKKIQTKALSLRPRDYNYEVHSAHIQQALAQAYGS